MVAAKKQRNQVDKMSRIVQEKLESDANAFVESAGDRALLQVFSADGTPVTFTKRITHRLKGEQFRRSGKSRSETGV
jgi:hypothetical protein